MGREIIANLANSGAMLSAAYDKNMQNISDLEQAVSSLDELFNKSDVVIDFSIAAGAIELLNYARTNPKPLVIGTTGLGEAGESLVNHASALMPVLQATNMSLGVAVLNRLAAVASKALSDFDIEIVEIQAGAGNGKFAAPDLIGTLNGLLCEANVLCAGFAVLVFEQQRHRRGPDSAGNVDMHGAHLTGGQGAEGGLILGKLAVV